MCPVQCRVNSRYSMSQDTLLNTEILVIGEAELFHKINKTPGPVLI